MSLTDRTLKYARTHFQGVRICWRNRPPEIVDAVEAVVLCSNPVVAGRIVGAVAQDRKLTDMLNSLIDGD